MATVKLAQNVPVIINELKYVDIVKGQYGIQVSLKGTIDGVPDTKVYPSFQPWVIGKALEALLAVAHPASGWPKKDDDASALPEKGLSVQVLRKGPFKLTARKVAGDEYPVFLLEEVVNSGEPSWLGEPDPDEPYSPASAVNPPTQQSPGAGAGKAQKLIDGIDRQIFVRSQIEVAVEAAEINRLRKLYPGASEDSIMSAVKDITTSHFITAERRGLI